MSVQPTDRGRTRVTRYDITPSPTCPTCPCANIATDSRLAGVQRVHVSNQKMRSFGPTPTKTTTPLVDRWGRLDAAINSNELRRPTITSEVGQGGERLDEATTDALALAFWLPRPPDNANSRGSSKAANRVKRDYWKELSRRLDARYHMPPVPAAPLPRARLTATYYYPNHRGWLDSDNAMRRLKPVADWLVGNGFLVNDTPAHLEWTVPTQVVDEDKSAPALCSVLLVLSPAPDPPSPRTGCH